MSFKLMNPCELTVGRRVRDYNDAQRVSTTTGELTGFTETVASLSRRVISFKRRTCLRMPFKLINPCELAVGRRPL